MTESFSSSKTRQNWPFLAFFNELLSTQNVNVARFARKVVCDFFCNFQTPWSSLWRRVNLYFIVKLISRFLYGVFDVLLKSDQKKCRFRWEFCEIVLTSFPLLLRSSWLSSVVSRNFYEFSYDLNATGNLTKDIFINQLHSDNCKKSKLIAKVPFLKK